jgi:hypothetical protein
MKVIFSITIGFLLAAPLIGSEGIYRGKKYRNIMDDERILSNKKLGIIDLTLWNSSLQDAQKKIGPSPINEDHYAPPNDSAQVCYEGQIGILLLISPNTKSSGEYPQKIQTIIISQNKNVDEKFAKCIESPKISEDLFFFGGLRLGMNREEVKKLWGNPGKNTSEIMLYKIRRIQKEYFTDDVSLYLEFKNDKLTFARMSRLAIR